MRNGVLEGADAATVSDRAVERGLGQVGSLGSGNHFLEVQAVDRVYDIATATQMGLSEGQVCVMIHTGSRGLGHQVCTDHVHQMGQAMSRYGIQVPDRQLACVPVGSPEGRGILGGHGRGGELRTRQSATAHRGHASGVRGAGGNVAGPALRRVA